jgi:hypothetical protein
VTTDVRRRRRPGRHRPLLTDGRSTAIANFRRALDADRLGIAPPATAALLPSSSWVRLGDGVDAFHQIRETLRAGGLGRIAGLAPAEPVGRPASPGPIDVVSPDGETLNMLELLTHLPLVNTASA